MILRRVSASRSTRAPVSQDIGRRSGLVLPLGQARFDRWLAEIPECRPAMLERLLRGAVSVVDWARDGALKPPYGDAFVLNGPEAAAPDDDGVDPS